MKSFHDTLCDLYARGEGMTFDAIVAGAGIWGCTVARRLAEAGRRVLVLEKRAAIGGNCRCEIDVETGIEVHTYGSHIFHTSNEEVWAFVRRFTEFNDYRHVVLARTKACGREEMCVGNRCTRGSDVLVASDAGRITSNWYDVIDPATIENMDCIKVSADENPPMDRRAIKDVFQGFGVVENADDGRRVIFPAKSAGKMLVQSGIDIRRHVRSFAGMYRKSIRAWSEKEAVIESHKQHRNITAYHQYIVKAELGGVICYIRFTVREDAGGKVRRNEVHSSTISHVTVYKAKGAELSGLGHAQVEDSTPFVDNKITFFLNGVKGGGEKKIGQENRSTAEGSPSTCVDLTQSHRDTEVPPTPTLNSNSYHTYHLPIGKTLLEEFFGASMKDKNLREFLAEPVDAGPCPRQKADDDVLLGRGEGAASTGASRTHGDEIFDAFIRGYTSKQWGVAPEKVDPSIIARLKVRDNYSTDYFDDPHQGIPSEGYNKMFERMLDHPNITVQCNCELVVDADVSDASTVDAGGARERGSDVLVASLKVRGEGAEWINDLLSRSCDSGRSDEDVASPVDAGPCPRRNQTQPSTVDIDLRHRPSPLPIYYSGPIDALFNYKFGHLPWRTLSFERETLSCPDYQGNSVVNYTDADVPFTRIHEFRHYHPEKVEVKVKGEGEQRKLASKWGFDAPKTVIMREYSAAWQPGDEPYYPIDNADSRALVAKYLSEVEKLNLHCSTSNLQPSTSLTIGGRLGAYRYYDMDKSVAAALAVPIA